MVVSTTRAVHGSGAGDEHLTGGSDPPEPGAARADLDGGGGDVAHTAEPVRLAMLDAAERLRKELSAVSLPFDLPAVAELRQERERLLSRMDGYVLPRLRRMDAPLLVVIGGSTGAGKSTLTNSLIGLHISPTGVLRPTTRAPVLVHNPGDLGAFLSRRILPGLDRRTMTGAHSLEDETRQRPSNGSILLVPHDAVSPGLAIIDSPDLDSHVQTNRRLAGQLFEAADLWLFVTTGTDYADLLPWELLTEAVDRRVSVAVVLDRMRPNEISAVRVHFATMLRDRGLGHAPLFTIPETTLVDGLLPASTVAPLQRWLNQQATDVVTRDGHVGRAVRGALELALTRVPAFVTAQADQAVADRGVRSDLDVIFARSALAVEPRLQDGTLIDARVRAAWQALTMPPEPTAEGRLRRRVQSALRVHSSRFEAISDAVLSSLVRSLGSFVQETLNRVSAAWAKRPESAGDLAQRRELTSRSNDFEARATAALRQWQADVLDGLHQASARGRAASADPSTVALVSLSIGADTGWVGNAARRLLASEAPGADPGEQVQRTRGRLLEVVRSLVDSERSRVDALLDEATGRALGGTSLQAAADGLRRALERAEPDVV